VLNAALGAISIVLVYLLGAMAIVYVPWTIRNVIQLDAPVILTTGTGGALIQGHAEGATGNLNQEILQ